MGNLAVVTVALYPLLHGFFIAHINTTIRQRRHLCNWLNVGVKTHQKKRVFTTNYSILFKEYQNKCLKACVLIDSLYFSHQSWIWVFLSSMYNCYSEQTKLFCHWRWYPWVWWWCGVYTTNTSLPSSIISTASSPHQLLLLVSLNNTILNSTNR